MQVVVDDGVGLEVDVRGSGPTLVLVHGFGGAKEDFTDHVDELARTHRVIAFDHRGHGDSDASQDPGAYTLDRLAADVLAVADAHGASTFRLLGHSMGGMVARRVVLSVPDRVESLVLMDTSPGPVPGIDGDALELAAQIAGEHGMTVLKELLDAHGALETPAHRRLLAQRPGYREFEDRKLERLSPVMWATLAREIRDQPDELGRLQQVRCPTLVLVGEQDELFLEPSRAMAAVIPGARLVVVPDAGHSPQFENPPFWFETLGRFLADVPTPRGVA